MRARLSAAEDGGSPAVPMHAPRVRGVPDNELELSAEFGLPFWSPLGAKVAARFKRTWEGRRDQYVQSVADHAGMTPDQLAQRCLNGDDLSDLVIAGSERVTKVGDAFYRDAVAKLVGRAFDQDVTLDEAEYLGNLLLTLEPLDVKVMRTAYASDYAGTEVRLYDVQEALSLEVAIIKGAMARLAAVGFIEIRTRVDGRYGVDLTPLPGEQVTTTWHTTGLGLRAASLCSLHMGQSGDVASNM